MTVSVAVIPSNQHLNSYAAPPGATEEKWATAVAAWTVRRLEELGHTARMFHVPGGGSSSTDELSQMLNQAAMWRPAYTLSIHSDYVGDAKQTGILMLMARESDRGEGLVLGRMIANAVGLPYKATWVYGAEARKINFLTMLRANSMRGSLVEVGEHGTKAEAAWNWEHIRDIGVGIAEALHVHLGGTLPTEEPTPEEGIEVDAETKQMIKETR